MLDLLALEAFVIVADVLNLRDAARRLNCSPSAVSRRLDRAERETGIDLLRRTTRATQLTERGRLFLPIARSLLDEERRAREAAARLREQRDEGASIALPGSVAELATIPGRSLLSGR
jgi:DNA-binding transcriptional LysR family regulator